MKKQLRTVVLLLTVAAVLFCGCGKQETVPELLDPIERIPDTAKAEWNSVFDLENHLANVYSPVSAVSFLQGGKTAAIYIRPGDTVQKGDVLAKLDDTALQKQLTDCRKRIADAEYNAKMADRSAEIDWELANKKLADLQAAGDNLAIALQKITLEQMAFSAQQAKDSQEQTIASLKTSLAKLQEMESQYILRAPCDGKVTWISDKLRVGYSAPADTPMVYLLQTDSAYLQTEFISNGILSSTPYIYAIVGDQQYDLTPVLADSEKIMADSLAGKTLTTQFHFTDESVVPAHGSYAIVCLMKNYKERVLCIPSNAVFKDDSGTYVYRVAGGQRIRTAISVGTVTALRTEIVSGLQEGDEVYVQG